MERGELDGVGMGWGGDERMMVEARRWRVDKGGIYQKKGGDRREMRR